MLSRYFISIATFLIWLPYASFADTAKHYLEFNAGYTHGELILGEHANLSQLQLTYGEVNEGYDFSITVPYFYLENMGSYSGVGDIVLRAGLKPDRKITSTEGLYGSVAVKLPTASTSKGLGTGEVDVGGFVSYTFGLNEVKLSMMGGYIITGDSSSQTYKDILVYGIGMSKYITPWYVYSGLEGREKTLDSGNDSLELTAGLFYRLGAKQFIKTEAFVGLNSDNSNYGISVGIVNWF